MKYNLYIKPITKKDFEIFIKFLKFINKKLKLKGEIDIHLLDTIAGHSMTTGVHEIKPDGQIIIKSLYSGRHIIDVLRTIAHELVHYWQYTNGKFDPKQPVQDIGGVIEDTANALAGRYVKEFLYQNKNIL